MSGIFSRPSVPPPPPPVEMPKELQTPIVDKTIVERNAADIIRRRRGRAATILAGETGAGAVPMAGASGTTPVLGG